MSSNNNRVMPSLSARTSSTAKSSSTSSKKSKSKSTKKSAKSSKKSTKSSKSKSSKITLKRGLPLAPLPSPQGVSEKQLTYTKQIPGLSTSMPVESNSSATWIPRNYERNYELVAPDKKKSNGKSVNMSNAADQRYKSGIGGVAKKNAARLENENQFAQQFSIALDQLHGCMHGNVIKDVPNSFYISDLPALLACMTRANPKTGKLQSYSQGKFFELFFCAGFKLVKDPRRYRGESIKKDDVLTGYHPDETAFLPGNAPSIAKVVVKKHDPQTNKAVKLSGAKGALAPDSDVYQLPSSCVNRKHLKNITNEDKENVISHMMTLNEDELEEFLDNRLTLLVKQRLLGHFGIKTNKNSAECKVLIVDAIKKRNEEELDEKPAAKPDI